MPWILISVLIVLIILGIVAILAKKKNKRPIDYYSFFIIGIIWTAFGIPLKNFALWGAGIVFLIIGLVNKNKWKKNRVRWSDLTPEEIRMKTFLIIILGILVLAGLTAWFYVGGLK